MKKYIVLLLVLALALSLCACGKPAADTTPTTTEGTQQNETTGQQTDGTTAPDLKALAMTCIDKSVDVLYDLIGQPNSSDYAPSCLGDGEDGNLYYDGFTVYTYREGDTETVSFVE